jgi:hypothetical protein
LGRIPAGRPPTSPGSIRRFRHGGRMPPTLRGCTPRRRGDDRTGRP